MQTINRQTTLGIVGGLGPLASAEFLRTIYEQSLGEREQHSPAVLMYSDPSFPDRTESFLAGSTDALLDRLVTALEGLRELGASKFVLCCVTIHYLLPKLPEHLRSRVVSLIDVAFDQLAHVRRKHLLICSSGSAKLGLFHNHPRWESVKPYIVVPDESDQHRIHYELINSVKRNRNLSELAPTIESLLAKYKVNSFIAGCSEIHLLAKLFESSNGNHQGLSCVDPLTTIAKNLAEGAL